MRPPMANVCIASLQTSCIPSISTLRLNFVLRSFAPHPKNPTGARENVHTLYDLQHSLKGAFGLQ
jgi:hypothetical protein